jgi:hypothetical protein
MSTKKILWLSLGAAVAITCATCAPVGKINSNDSDPQTLTNKPAPETLTVKPAPVAALADGPRARIEAAIDNVRSRELLTTNGAWTVFHGMLGLGPTVMLTNPDTGERVNAEEYACSGGEMRGLQFIQTKDGVDIRNWADGQGVGQGHQDQFIAEMAQWGMAPDHKFVIYGREYTYMDFVRNTEMRARVTQNQELSWAIEVIAQYLGTDISWTNSHGEKLRFNDLVRYELDGSVEQAPCGGTHRLFGLSWAYHLHVQRGGKIEGVWKEVVAKTIKYRDLAKKYQNPDGSLSTNHFKEPGNSPDKSLRIASTGHMLEWLALALPDEDLRAPWMQEAANALALTILDLQGSPMEGGALYHAIHGLLMYHQRVYGGYMNDSPAPMIPLPPKGPLEQHL